MIRNGIPVPLPARTQLSFSPLLTKMRARLKEFGGAEASYIKDLISRAEVLDIAEGLSSKDLEKHSTIIDELMRLIAPPGLTDNEIKAIASPWDFKPFSTSRRLKTILDKAGGDYSFNFNEVKSDDLYIASCTMILGVHFGYEVPSNQTFYYQIPDLEKNRTHYYRLAINADFVVVEKTDRAIDISKDDYHELMDNYRDIELWKSKFPVDSWTFSGFMVLNMMDVTSDQVLSNLTRNLLGIHDTTISPLEKDISEILRTPISLSFISVQGQQLIQGGTKDMSPLMMGGEESAECKDFFCEWSYDEMFEKGNDLAIPDVEAFAERSQSPFAQNLLKAGLKSFYIAQIHYGGEQLGLLELGSRNKGALNSAIGPTVDMITPILSVAGNRLKQEYENRIEAIIQAECTTIHPSVKWRFVEEANKHILAIDNGNQHSFSDLVFKDVYPLFGQLDIRNSSTIRNEGIKHDLQTQLNGAKKVFDLAIEKEALPLYEEIIYMLDSLHSQLETDMVSASEQEILQFLGGEVEPILEHLATKSAALKKSQKAYKNLLHPELGFVYRERQSFDDAVNTVNKVLSRCLDQKQIEAQAMFPHHFERYATDGLEFNMYIGESISPNRGFHPLLVKNLRLWQLIVMVEMERAYDEVKQDLDKPLSVASLVLAHSTPLSIQYRLDEKQFDVEGAYNARYEIVKKRIDKAYVKGTEERITEPGKMVVVYSSAEDEKEYLRYFKFMQSKGYLEDKKPEILLLEDLQGVSGLKAIRLGVAYDRTSNASDLSMEEIMREIEVSSIKPS